MLEEALEAAAGFFGGATGEDPAIGEAAHAAQDTVDVFLVEIGVLCAAHPDGDGALYGEGEEAGVGDAVVFALKGDEGFGPQAAHESDLLDDARGAVLEVFAEGFELDGVPADADAKAETAAAEEVQGGGLLGDEGGLALGEDDDAGAEANLVGDGGEVAEEDEGLVEGVFVVVDEAFGAVGTVGVGAEDMVVDEDVVVADLLGRLGEILDGFAVEREVVLGEQGADLDGHGWRHLTVVQQARSATVRREGSDRSR